MQNSDLIKRVEELTDECSSSLNQLIQGHDALRRALIRTYLLWTDCSKIDGFLDNLYEQKGVKGYNTQSNSPNFKPILRIVFSKTKLLSKHYQRLNQYNAALVTMYNEHTQNPNKYRSKTEAKLIEFTRKTGGISKLAQMDDEKRRGREDVGSEKNIITTPLSTFMRAFREMPEAKIRMDLISNLPNLNGIGLFSCTMPILTDSNNAVALLGIRQDNGVINIVGYSHSEEAINKVKQNIGHLSFANLSNEIRILAEVIQSQMYPRKAMPPTKTKRDEWISKYIEDKSYITTKDEPGWEKGQPIKPLPSHKKLIFRGQNRDIIMSGSRIRCSVVTRCKPHDFPFTQRSSAFLQYAGLCLIERMIETGEIFLSRYRSSIKYEQKDSLLRHGITISRNNETFQSHLDFYDVIDNADLKSSFQSMFKFDELTREWGFHVSPTWIATLRQGLLERWFDTLGKSKQVKRQNNQIFRFIVDTDKLNIGFNISQNGKHPLFEIPINRIGRGKIVHDFLSKDIAPVLYNLSNTQIEGDILFAGNASAMTINYTTKAGKYEIAIPTAMPIKNGFIRNDALFKEYRYA